MSELIKRVSRHRQKLCEAGLRPIQIWVPGTRRPEFQEECRRQSQRLRQDPQEQEVLIIGGGGGEPGGVGLRRSDIVTVVLPGAYHPVGSV